MTLPPPSAPGAFDAYLVGASNPNTSRQDLAELARTLATPAFWSREDRRALCEAVATNPALALLMVDDFSLWQTLISTIEAYATRPPPAYDDASGWYTAALLDEFNLLPRDSTGQISGAVTELVLRKRLRDFQTRLEHVGHALPGPGNTALVDAITAAFGTLREQSGQGTQSLQVAMDAWATGMALAWCQLDRPPPSEGDTR